MSDAPLASRVQAEQVPEGEEVACARAALRDSVKHHLVADVPVGAFLSAGLDSSTVVGLALENDDTRCLAITLGFQVWRWLNSSPELDAWKGSRLLRRPNNRPTRRWAYTLLARHPGAKDALS